MTCSLNNHWPRCAYDNVHSILGLLSTQSPTKKWLKLSTQDWVLIKSKFWVEIECSIHAFFPYYHWVLNKSKFWVGIEYSISQFFTTYWVWNLSWTPNYWHLLYLIEYTISLNSEYFLSTQFSNNGISNWVFMRNLKLNRW